MAAHKGNTTYKGNPYFEFGRSKVYNDPEEMQADIDAYFKLCDTRVTKMYSKAAGDIIDVPNPTPYTIEGLCNALDCTRQTLLNYEKREGYEAYFDTISRAKSKILQNKVERGLDGISPPHFAIFDLVNNSDYKNTTSTELTGKDGKDLSLLQPMTPEQIKDIAEKL